VAVAISQRKRNDGFICAVCATLYQKRERETVLIIEAASEVLRLWQGLGCQGRHRRPTPDPRGLSDRF
jgi:hypothetical protein